MSTDILESEFNGYAAQVASEYGKALAALLSSESCVGDLIKIDYEECEVLVHDSLRKEVGGLPLGCFLLATRLSPDGAPNPTDEDSSLILLRVIGQARLPNAAEAENFRFLAGQRASDTDEHWDADGKTDQYTLHQLRYAGVRCRVLGSFRVQEIKPGRWETIFGADISNFYSGKGMKVYKPAAQALKTIVNYRRPKLGDSHPLAGLGIPVGRVRYAAAEIKADGGDTGVIVEIDPTDLVARRTAMFGMSRTGKSNTTKVIAQSVFKLREQDPAMGRVGQLILDVNGEYANENAQDGDGINTSCLKNVWRNTKNSSSGDVVTYGMEPHPNDPGRRVTKVNFFGNNPSKMVWLKDAGAVDEALVALRVGKQAIDNRIADVRDKYITSFRNSNLDTPTVYDESSATRLRRWVMVYRAALAAAGFKPPQSQTTANIEGLFGTELISSLKNSSTENKTDRQDYVAAADILGKATASWDEFSIACRALRRFIEDQSSGYADFNQAYMKKKGHSWHDDTLTGLLEIFKTPNGVRSFQELRTQHDANAADDYAESIVDDLLEGRLVIFDQALGDPDLIKYSAERIMIALFRRQQRAFIHPQKDAGNRIIPPKDVVVYVEEAHNLLPAGNNADTRSIWSRVAKEGSKYRIGLVYATQEPSSIQGNILKNTDNWFVAHLNNTDETRELRKYYDFEDFAQSIKQVPDPGFLRMRTLSSAFITPIQVLPFKVEVT